MAFEQCAVHLKKWFINVAEEAQKNTYWNVSVKGEHIDMHSA
jgi:hypothetical protein